MSIQVETDAQPGGVTGELEIALQVGQLRNLLGAVLPLALRARLRRFRKRSRVSCPQSGLRSQLPKPHSQPRRIACKFQESREIRQLFDLGRKDGGLGDVLFAAAHAVARFGKEAAFAGA